MRAAVVGHVEWVDFIEVDRVPAAGEIVHARGFWETPGGGGAGAAVQMQKLTGRASFFTALGADEIGRRTKRLLVREGLQVHAGVRDETSRRAVTFVDGAGERTIAVLGSRLSPSGADPLPWSDLAETDAVYFTAGDVAALRAARAARVLVATTRILRFLKAAQVRLDAVVGSALDEGELYRAGDLSPPPALAVMTEGEAGGTFEVGGGPPQRYEATPPAGPVMDRYGAGDSFAAGLAFALGTGARPSEAVAFAARCGAAVVAGRGPYSGQLTAREI